LYHQAPRKNKLKQGIISKKISNLENLRSKNEECKCPRVLIADDEPFNLIALEGLLHQLNVGDSEKSFHGKEALDKIESNFITGTKSCGPHH
jgi:PleD family two-component response regulator